MGHIYTDPIITPCKPVVSATERHDLLKRSRLLYAFSSEIFKNPQVRQAMGLPPQIAGYLENARLSPVLDPLPVDRIHRELIRRIEEQREIRRAAALSAGDDEQFAIWSRARDRGSKLTRILLDHLSAKAFFVPSTDPLNQP